MTRQIYVDQKAKVYGQGTKEAPFLTINEAAQIAAAGDTVIVSEGEYREWVKPAQSGLSDRRRITYRATPDQKVVIKGSEKINNWENIESGVWKTVIPNAFFGDFNPYKEEIFGDWLYRTDPPKHLGDVYLNGMSFYEANSYEDVLNIQTRSEAMDGWTEKMFPIINVDQTRYVWFAQVDPDTTTIYANFHEYDPNEECVEINVRRSCFYPMRTGINYITVSGFEMAQAATPWSPPTADQPGLIGAHWSKGWIIEDNVIHDSKCSAISIGKEASTGDMHSSRRKDKPGYIYQIESVFLGEQAGWTKEKIGSHLIRNNTIFDCGQNGIVGHLGCIFSTIENNHIYNIGVKREYFGHEIGGIKLHAAIDVRVVNNSIHHCTLGAWFDWQTQGTQISRNIFYENTRDLFIEVSHGPFVVDHNILASEYAFDNMAQGGAYVNNLICGVMVCRKVLNRSTPYHLPHSTKIAGFTVVQGGDDRYYNNIFVGVEGFEGIIRGKRESIIGVGTAHFDGAPITLEEYFGNVHSKPGDVEIFLDNEQPIYAGSNAYLNGAEGFDRETYALVDKSFDPKIQVVQEGDALYLVCKMPEKMDMLVGTVHSTDTLPKARLVDADFEAPDGQKLTLDIDLLGNKKDQESKAGPLESIKAGENKIKIWSLQ